MTERLDSVLTGSQSSRTDFKNEYFIRFLDIHFRAFKSSVKVRAIVHMEVPEVLVIALHLCLNIALGNDQTSHGESKRYFIVKKSMLVTDV